MIVSPITPHSRRIYSHRAGWGHLWAKTLNQRMAYEADYLDAPVIYLDHGMEFRPDSKGLNYFLKSKESYEKLAARLKLLQDFNGEVVSLDIPCPLYGTRGRSRLCDDASDSFKRLDFDRIDQVCRRSKTLTHRDRDASVLVIGDSHSISAWVPGAAIERNDGKTLHGALNLGFGHWLQHYPGLTKLRTYFGNIDIRFHLCRQPMPQKAAIELAARYVAELIKCRDLFGVKEIEVVAALPIEDESRVLPKTGYYKGQPFYGNWADRTAVQWLFNSHLENLCIANGFWFIKWPEHFMNDERQLTFDVMEKPRSVHISPQHYLWKIKSDNDNPLLPGFSELLPEGEDLTERV
jgi:hypothetical protein